ncbi:hypothetical protein BJ122_12038 [Rhodopseudomonas faecalis]|uniref:Uncharacterized protein n=1 Tax=Rhodopseudomonas faecalis TaxID=99655 RepID=A0A318TIB6_9BRAD|nr:hypothetical protein BJ122_12038 [Rhodopseudomonas faecalis]
MTLVRRWYRHLAALRGAICHTVDSGDYLLPTKRRATQRWMIQSAALRHPTCRHHQGAIECCEPSSL